MVDLINWLGKPQGYFSGIGRANPRGRNAELLGALIHAELLGTLIHAELLGTLIHAELLGTLIGVPNQVREPAGAGVGGTALLPLPTSSCNPGMCVAPGRA